MHKIWDFWRRSRGFVRLLVAQFFRDDLPSAAAALTFTSLLSLVPLMTVTFALLSAFPIADRLGAQLQDFVFANFVPASGEVVQRYLQGFSSNAGKLTGAGALFLLVTALMLMANIDQAFNRIWRTRQRKSYLRTFITYWAILTIGPLLMGLSLALTSYLTAWPPLHGPVAELGRHHGLLDMAPALASALGFFLLYLLVPNRRVPVTHALAGALFATLLFEPGKRVFGWYLTAFPGYEAIYGALAAIPVFLLWLYIAWLITLSGALFAYCLSIHQTDPGLEQGQCGAGLLAAYWVLYDLWQAQREGITRSMGDLMAGLPGLSAPALEGLLAQLRAARLVLHGEGGRWALARDLDQVSLYQLYRCGEFALPRTETLHPGLPAEAALKTVCDRLEQQLQTDLAISLAALFEGHSEE